MSYQVSWSFCKKLTYCLCFCANKAALSISLKVALEVGMNFYFLRLNIFAFEVDINFVFLRLHFFP